MPTPDWFSQILNRELTSIQLSELQIDQLRQHYELLLRWNQRMNLTTVKPGPETVIRHYCESLFFAAHIPAGRDRISVLDLGSGAGFPGIPIAILRSQWRVTLVESGQRKAVFLRESSRRLGNVVVASERMEDIRESSRHLGNGVLGSEPMEDISQQGNWVVARAVDPYEILLQVPRLAANVGLMIGEDDFLAIRNDSRVAWAEPVRLPWGDRKICVYGVSSTWNVPRETSKWEK